MRRFGSAVILAALLVVGAAALASGDSAQPGKSTTLKFYSPTVQIKVIDLVDPGTFNLGDGAAFSDDLLTAKGGKTVGFDGGTCTVVRVKDAATGTGTEHCLVTFSVAGGQITTQGLTEIANLAPSGTQSMAITGGTGRYSKARGKATIEFLEGGAAANVTLSISK
jgi:hypothetical protein